MSGESTWLYARLWLAVVAGPDVGGGTADLGRAWVNHCLGRLPGDLWAGGLDRREVPVPPGAARTTLWAQGNIFRSGHFRQTKPTEQALERAWRQFGGEVEEVHAGLIVFPEGGRGVVPIVSSGAAEVDSAPGRVFLECGLPLGNDEHGLPGETWLVDLADDFARIHPVDYAAVTPSRVLVTEDEQLAPPGPIALAAREVLRSYEWVTVLPPELAERLGGLEGLHATGAFHDVHELAGGAVWAQATATFAEYTPERVEAVFEALRPVLPDRRLKTSIHGPNPYVLYDRVGELPDPVGPPRPAPHLTDEQLRRTLKK